VKIKERSGRKQLQPHSIYSCRICV